MNQIIENLEIVRLKKQKKRKLINTIELVGLGIMLFGVVFYSSPFILKFLLGVSQFYLSDTRFITFLGTFRGDFS